MRAFAVLVLASCARATWRVRALAVLPLASCDADAREPYAIVTKLSDYERRMFLDEASAAAFRASAMPSQFTVTMETLVDGEPNAIFVREYRGGQWWSSSPSPDTIVFGEPRIEPGCDDCHRASAEALGMFTLAAAAEAAQRNQTALIMCPAEDVMPCEPSVYRAIEWR